MERVGLGLAIGVTEMWRLNLLYFITILRIHINKFVIHSNFPALC